MTLFNKMSIIRRICFIVIVFSVIIGIIAIFSIKTPNIISTTDLITDTATKSISNTFRYFTSIEETYQILEKVASELEYIDIWKPQSTENILYLTKGNYYELDGRRFYSQMAFIDYLLQKNDQNGDSKINCRDYAELFYKYAQKEGFYVRIIGNSELEHAFNSVNINGTWVSIEPQAAEIGLFVEPYLKNYFSNYDPVFDSIIKGECF